MLLHGIGTGLEVHHVALERYKDAIAILSELEAKKR
jgi:hypothetical protein